MPVEVSQKLDVNEKECMLERYGIGVYWFIVATEPFPQSRVENQIQYSS